MEKENAIPTIPHEKTIMPRSVKSVSEAQDVIRPLVNKILTNDMLGCRAKIYPKSLNEIGNGNAVAKSISPALHAKAVANIDILYQNAAFDAPHPDAKGRKEINQVHRLGSLMYDEENNKYIPVKITVFEYNPNTVDNVGQRLVDNLYSIEAVRVIDEVGVGRAPTDDSPRNPRIPSTDPNFNKKMQELILKVSENTTV